MSSHDLNSFTKVPLTLSEEAEEPATPDISNKVMHYV